MTIETLNQRVVGSIPTRPTNIYLTALGHWPTQSSRNMKNAVAIQLQHEKWLEKINAILLTKKEAAIAEQDKDHYIQT